MQSKEAEDCPHLRSCLAPTAALSKVCRNLIQVHVLVKITRAAVCHLDHETA